MLRPASLLRLYPRAWRERYGDEFLELVGQTGLGPRVLFDVVTAASREWVRALAGGGPGGVIAEQGRRGLGLYGIMLLSFAIIQPFVEDAQRIDFVSLRTQVDLLTLFVLGAVAARLGHMAAWRYLLRGRATRGEAYFGALCAAGFAAIATGLASTRIGNAALFSHPGFLCTLMLAEEFSRPAAIRRAIEGSPRQSPGRIGMAN